MSVLVVGLCIGYRRLASAESTAPPFGVVTRLADAALTDSSSFVNAPIAAGHAKRG